MRTSFALVVIALPVLAFEAAGCRGVTPADNPPSAIDAGDTADRQPAAPGGAGAGGTAGASGEAGASGASGASGAGGLAGAGGAAGVGGAAGATGVGGGAGAPSSTPDAGPGGPPPCPDIFAPTVQSFSIDIGAADWANIQSEFLTAGALADATFVNYQPLYYPVVFHYGAEVVNGAYIRLKGDSSWREAVAFDGSQGKMQFVLAFDQIDSKASFHGTSKITFDMPRTDLTFMHDRISNTWLRSIGIPALCATSARLSINGSYYGLFVAEERVGHHFITEFFPDNAGGDLFKGGWTPETNKTTPNWTRLQSFWNATQPSALAAIVDLQGSLPEWAAEALLNDGDGYWGGDHNFFLYDQGAKGYVFLPNDLDSTLDYLGDFTNDPVTWWSSRSGRQFIGPQYLVVMNDATLRGQYVSALAAQLPRWDVAQIQALIDTWSVQIRDSVATDPHKPADTTLAVFDTAVALARRGVRDRADFVTSWLACQQSGVGEDRDGDGFIWCRDCRDDDASIHAGAQEICGNDVDENCNGLYDDGCAAAPDGGAGDGP